MGLLSIVALCVGLGAVIVGAIVIAVKVEKKRTADLQEAAQALGFEFMESGDPALLAGIDGISLFAQGRNRVQSNLLRTRTDNLDVAIFDYRYTVGSGKQSHTAHQTVVSFRFNGPELPAFSLSPESIWSKLGSAFGYQDLDFDQHPDFSKKYLLRGEDEQAIRAAFTDGVLNYYAALPGLSTEAAGNRLVFYRANKRAKPQDLQTFLKDGYGVLAQFLKGMSETAGR